MFYICLSLKTVIKRIDLDQPFSKWVPRHPGVPRDCVRGAAKKLRILTFNKKKKKTDISYMTYMNILNT